MEFLVERQLSNLSIEQLDEIRRESGQAIASLRHTVAEQGSKGDYTRMRNFEKYHSLVKSVLKRKAVVFN